MPASRASHATPRAPAPGLLLAAHPGDSPTWDRAPLPPAGLVLGRAPTATIPVADRHLSRRHARFYPDQEALSVQDLGSGNGTFVEGVRLAPHEAVALCDGALIRCGCCLLVGVHDVTPLLRPAPRAGALDLMGRFHGPRLMAALYQAVASGRGIGLVGDVGSGKDQAVEALARIRRHGGSPYAHPLTVSAGDLLRATAAGPGGDDRLPAVLSSPSHAAAWLRAAGDRIVTIGQGQELPEGAQQTLARALETSVGSGVGPTLAVSVESRQRARRGTGASESPPPAERASAEALAAGVTPPLAEALHWIGLPPLAERRADIPDLFSRRLQDAAAWFHVDPLALLRAVQPAHLEALCLADYAGRNVRAVSALADAFAAVAADEPPPSPAALSALLADAFPENPVVLRTFRRPHRHD